MTGPLLLICHDDKVCPKLKDNEFDGNENFYIISSSSHFLREKKKQKVERSFCLIAKQPYRIFFHLSNLSVDPVNREPTSKNEIWAALS